MYGYFQGYRKFLRISQLSTEPHMLKIAASLSSTGYYSLAHLQDVIQRILFNVIIN